MEYHPVTSFVGVQGLDCVGVGGVLEDTSESPGEIEIIYFSLPQFLKRETEIKGEERVRETDGAKRDKSEGIMYRC